MIRRLILAIVVSVLWLGACSYGVVYKEIRQYQDCTGYLGRAADANTVELAKTELDTAIAYIERNELTEGYTSILFKTPDEDLGFWYRNLKSSRAELNDLAEDAAPLERSNMLLKLRETLLDEDGKSTYPTGLARYPHNTFWGIVVWLGVVILTGFWGWVWEDA